MPDNSPSYIRVFAMLIFMFGCTVAGLHGQEVVLFEEYNEGLAAKEQRLLNTIQSLNTTRRVRIVSIDPAGFSGDLVQANLFQDQSLALQRHFVPKSTQLRSWCGKSPDSPASGAFIINQTRISGHISAAEGSFEIIPLNENGLHMIIEHDNSGFGGCGNEVDQEPITIQEHQQNTSSPRIKNKPTQRSIDQSECVVRLLVGYTSAAKENTMSVFNRTMVEHINLAVLLMNQSYVNSLVNQRVELAHLYEVSDEESDNSSVDVNDLRDSTDGRWDEIHIRRDQYSADLVALVTGGSYAGVCGRAYGFDYEDASKMFQVTEYNCAVSNMTLSHEFGHLQGCRHEIDTSTSPFAYGHGFAQFGYYRTIMAVCCGEERINYWSNPYLYYPGLGSMGTLDLNYNAMALNDSYPVVADHRMNPDSIDSDEMLATDHAITSTTMGTIFSSDTTLTEGCLILQSESRIKLTNGFKSYPGAMGTFRIIDGCGNDGDLSASGTTTAPQRDARPVKIDNENKSGKSVQRDRSQ